MTARRYDDRTETVIVHPDYGFVENAGNWSATSTARSIRWNCRSPAR